MDLIAHAPEDLRHLLNEVRELREALARMDEDAQAWHDALAAVELGPEPSHG